jgi:hypothetical protein
VEWSVSTGGWQTTLSLPWTDSVSGASTATRNFGERWAGYRDPYYNHQLSLGDLHELSWNPNGLVDRYRALVLRLPVFFRRQD